MRQGGASSSSTAPAHCRRSRMAEEPPGGCAIARRAVASLTPPPARPATPRGHKEMRTTPSQKKSFVESVPISEEKRAGGSVGNQDGAGDTSSV